MKFSSQTLTISLAASAWWALGAAATPWTYNGATGPEHWAKISAEYQYCAQGQQQSPIDLTAAVSALVAPPELSWQPFVPQALVHDQQALHVKTAGDAGGLRLGATEFALSSIRFHAPSEHTIQGQRFPLEAQFMHAAEDGRFATISVFFVEGEADKTLDKLWSNAPTSPGTKDVEFAIDPTALLPNGSEALHYAGSLTTPPCSETVSWSVLVTPRTASAQQLAAYQTVFGENARPTRNATAALSCKRSDVTRANSIALVQNCPVSAWGRRRGSAANCYIQSTLQKCPVGRLSTNGDETATSAPSPIHI